MLSQNVLSFLFLLLYDPFLYPLEGSVSRMLYGFVIEIRQYWDDSKPGGSWSPRPNTRVLRIGERFLRLAHSSMDGECWQRPDNANKLCRRDSGRQTRDAYMDAMDWNTARFTATMPILVGSEK